MFNFVGKFIDKNSQTILNEQIKELDELRKIAESLSLPENSFELSHKIENKDLAYNENVLHEFHNFIREEWQRKCFEHTYKQYKSPLFLGDSLIVNNTIFNKEVNFTYERFIEDITLTDYVQNDNANYSSFSTLTTSGMAAINLTLSYSLSFFSNDKIDILFSGAYYETIKLINNFHKMHRINAIAYEDIQKNNNEYFDIFFVEPIMADEKLTVSNIDRIIEIISETEKNNLKILILDTSYIGSTYNLNKLLHGLKEMNVIIANIRSLVKLDQCGFEFCNAGLITWYIPTKFNKIFNVIKKDFNAYRNSTGSNLSYYELCLLDSPVWYNFSGKYSSTLLNNNREFINKIPKSSKWYTNIHYSDLESKLNSPVIHLILKSNEERYYEALWKIIIKCSEKFNTNIMSRNSFGFRNLSVEYFKYDTEFERGRRIFKISIGKMKGFNYHMLISIFEYLLEYDVNDLLSLSEKLLIKRGDRL